MLLGSADHPCVTPLQLTPIGSKFAQPNHFDLIDFHPVNITPIRPLTQFRICLFIDGRSSFIWEIFICRRQG